MRKLFLILLILGLASPTLSQISITIVPDSVDKAGVADSATVSGTAQEAAHADSSGASVVAWLSWWASQCTTAITADSAGVAVTAWGPADDDWVVADTSTTQTLIANLSASFGQKLSHLNVLDTYIEYTTDQIDFWAGNHHMLKLDETTNGGVFVNEDGQNQDFRVEGNTDENLIFADGSEDRVYIGADSGSAKLSVAGTFSASDTVEGTKDTSATNPIVYHLYTGGQDTLDEPYLHIKGPTFLDEVIMGGMVWHVPDLPPIAMGGSGFTIGDDADISFDTTGIKIGLADSMRFGTGPSITASATKLEISKKIAGPGFVLGDEDTTLTIFIAEDNARATYMNVVGANPRTAEFWATANDTAGYGVYVYSKSESDSGKLYGVYSWAQKPPGKTQPEELYAGYFLADGGLTGIGVYASASAPAGTAWAGYFASGDVKSENDIWADTVHAAIQGNVAGDLTGTADSAVVAGTVDVSSIGWAQGIWYTDNAVYIEPLSQESGIEFVAQDQREKIAVDVDGTTITRNHAEGLHVIGGDVDYATIASTCTTWTGSGAVDDSLAALRAAIDTNTATNSTQAESLAALTTDIATIATAQGVQNDTLSAHTTDIANLQATKADTSVRLRRGIYTLDESYSNTDVQYGSASAPMFLPLSGDTLIVEQIRFVYHTADHKWGALAIKTTGDTLFNSDTLAVDWGYHAVVDASISDSLFAGSAGLFFKVDEYEDGSSLQGYQWQVYYRHKKEQ